MTTPARWQELTRFSLQLVAGSVNSYAVMRKMMAVPFVRHDVLRTGHDLRLPTFTPLLTMMPLEERASCVREISF